MYASWFTYPITRPYPFRWFTIVTIVGGVCLTVVFSLINLASSGFYLTTTYTDDPNGTMAAPMPWFMKPPFNWERNLDTKCQPRLLSVGDQFFATSLGLQYEVTAITLSDGDVGTSQSRSAIPYMNNTPEDCYVSEFKVNLRKDDTTEKSTWMSRATSFTSAKATCFIVTAEGSVELTLNVGYTGETSHTYSYVIEDNYTTHASIWWGTRLLNAYYTGVLEVMSQMNREDGMDDSSYWTTGSISHMRNAWNSNSIRSLNFFNSSASFLKSTGGNNMISLSNFTWLHENPDYYATPVMEESRHLAKLLQSVVAVDLGGCQSPNLLLSEDGLKYAISAPDDPNRQVGGILYNRSSGGWANRFSKVPLPGTLNDDNLTLVNESYAAFRPLTGDLACRNATIVSQYICSVPQKKSTGTMLLAMIIADLVFLQAAWKLLNLVAEGILPKSDQVRMCEGCVAAQYQQLQMNALSNDGQRSISHESHQDDGSTTQLITR